MTHSSRNPISLLSKTFIIPFIILWSVMIVLFPFPFVELIEYTVFTFLGILGAIFANSTGAGGGVVFIPMFNQLSFTEAQSVATSFGIQCFGMTAGAITWWMHYRLEKTELRLWQGFKRICSVCAISSVVGIWSVYGLELKSPSSLHHSFSWFSLMLGIFIILTVYFVKPTREVSVLSFIDYLVVVVIGLCGGALTAWLSVGVGELLAIYLILRRFDTTMAVASAVVVSAITVWSAIWQHTFINNEVYWQVVLFAGPGAIIGGIFAKTLVSYMSATRLKLFFAFWLFLIGIVGTSS